MLTIAATLAVLSCLQSVNAYYYGYGNTYSTGGRIGTGVGVAVFGLILVGLLLCCMTRRRRRIASMQPGYAGPPMTSYGSGFGFGRNKGGAAVAEPAPAYQANGASYAPPAGPPNSYGQYGETGGYAPPPGAPPAGYNAA